MNDIDNMLLLYSRERGLRYTRYADDLSFSGEAINLRELIKIVREALSALGLQLNNKKISVQRRGARQVVTGIVVNDRLNVLRAKRRKFRQEVYYVRKYGLDGHFNRIREFRQNYLEHLIGVGEHIFWVDPRNESVAAEITYLRALKKAYETDSA